MNKQALNKLEYTEILKKLESFCHTYIGKEYAQNLQPSNKKEEVLELLTETMQASNLIKRNSNPPLSSIADIRVSIKLLEADMKLSPRALLDIANILELAENLKDYFNPTFSEDEDFYNLKTHFDMLYSNKSIVQNIKQAIIDENTISDTASSTLRSIRRKKMQLEQEIKQKLNNLLHSSNYSKYIQENVVTIRNDRFVIPVKEEYRNQIKGFIHDISASGSTVFIEPISVFELNSQINDLKVLEIAEIEKILKNLSTALKPYVEELKMNINSIGKLDFIFAKAKYSDSIKATTPIITDEKIIDLKSARHPLIDSEKVVPTSITLGKDFNLLIITGPNTGGKTVTLKTVGLLTCMACSGLNIPAKENSKLFVFDEIFADIGDDQSISDSLSTFSSHITNISRLVNTCTENSLILVDELGSGTDPLEGANLAISILEYFRNKKALTIATTHYQELKKYALLTDGIQNASVEFDIENLRPTYRLLLGIPGKSNAFAIAQKLGLKKEIIDNAKTKLNKQDVDFENLLKNIYDNKLLIEKEKEEIEKNLNQITLLRKNLQRDDTDIKNKAKELINKAKNEARQILLDAKSEANSIISKMNQIASSQSSLTELNNLRNTLNDQIKKQSISQDTDNLNTSSIDREKIIPNAKVFVKTLGQNGIVISKISKSDEVMVQIGLIKTNVNIKFLESPHNMKDDLTKPTLQSHSSVSKTKTAKSEINVIGLTTDEAIPLVDKFLDDCFLAKLQTARIVHGKGTGKLRSSIHSFLRKHKHVKSFRIGTYGEGEMGVTIVEIKY